MINFKGFNLLVDIGKYQIDGTSSLRLIDASDGIPYCVLSSRLDVMPSSEDHIWLKNYSENVDIAQFMIDEGYLELTGNKQTYTYPTHMISFPEVKFTQKLKDSI